MDADSCFASDFFSACASKFISSPPSIRSNQMFISPIFFDRNANSVASPVVMADMLWCAAGMGTMYEGSGAKLPTSAYAMTHELAARVGFWDAGPEAIGEDLHVGFSLLFFLLLSFFPSFLILLPCSLLSFLSSSSNQVRQKTNIKPNY